jgi:hypothetical protein
MLTDADLREDSPSAWEKRGGRGEQGDKERGYLSKGGRLESRGDAVACRAPF